MQRGLGLLLVASLLFASVATASVQQGDIELGFSASYYQENGADNQDDWDQFSLSGSIGYFFTDNIKGEAGAFGSWADDEDDYGIGVAGKYHFMPTKKWVPYVGAQFFWWTEDNDTDFDGNYWGPLVGVRYELNDHVDLFGEYQYRVVGGDEGDFVDDAHLLQFGLIYQFN